MQKTRRVILDFLKQNGRGTLDELAVEAGVAPMSARGHLSILERDGLITYTEERVKVGRPRFVYVLTDRGHEFFPKSYHVLCNRVLEAVIGTSPEAASDLASRVAIGWADEHQARVAGKSFSDRVKTLAAIRTEEGAMASCEAVGDSYLLHQRNCPASCVASRYPQVICTAEIGFIRRLLGATVERVTWAQNGDDCCTYRIREWKADANVAAAHDPLTSHPAPAD